MDIDLRYGVDSDLDGLIKLYKNFRPESEEEGIKKFFIEKIKKKEVMIATIKGIIVGLGCWVVIQQISKKIAYAQTILVNEKYRKKGIGRRIFMQSLVDMYYDGVEEVITQTNIQNKISLKMHLAIPKIKFEGYEIKGGNKEINFSIPLKKYTTKEIEYIKNNMI